MMQFFFRAILGLCLLGAGLPIRAQSGFRLDTNRLSLILTNIDSNQLYHDFELRSSLGNTSADTLNLRWTLYKGADWPANWLVSVADETISYIPGLSSSPFPTTLYPGDSAFYFASYVFPQGQEGCAEYMLVLTDYDQLSIVYDTIFYQFSLNSTDCNFLTNTETLVDPDLRVYPNPTEGKLFLETSHNFQEVEILNLLGQLVLRLPRVETGLYDISPIAPGEYYLFLKTGGDHLYVRKIEKSP